MPTNSKTKPSLKTTFLKKKKAVQARIQGFLDRRPHRTFQLTRRRDYARSLKLPGYWKFTSEVNKTIWKFRKQLLGATAVYFVLTLLLIDLVHSAQDGFRRSNPIRQK